jgi:hypothetical protein
MALLLLYETSVSGGRLTASGLRNSAGSELRSFHKLEWGNWLHGSNRLQCKIAAEGGSRGGLATRSRLAPRVPVVPEKSKVGGHHDRLVSTACNIDKLGAWLDHTETRLASARGQFAFRNGEAH